MKLTIIRLDTFSDQDRICLGKIWPAQPPNEQHLDENHRLYAARFNERLLAAVKVTINGSQGTLNSLCVREVTRRRGVGQYLVEEVMHDNPQVSRWTLSKAGVEESLETAAFAKAMGFTVHAEGWVRG
ncbi:aspartate 1-decarboxylase autocleavage activator PanM [Kluyvera sichuanensis]|uniref:PanD regulatory factor n=1 Tax=Kluyvera sichuanensis TaxID=2725494 RepID=A0ABR6RR46_9ENTR|nr:aspartate 1-decarboxylase autocleavage activator PanM [Kluyvera sichuanensis]MBC1185611.1 aspartate 1-decarboxylase autocleavage activator PanM [Kluyvera sichuanensis]